VTDTVHLRRQKAYEYTCANSTADGYNHRDLPLRSRGLVKRQSQAWGDRLESSVWNVRGRAGRADIRARRIVVAGGDWANQRAQWRCNG